MTNAANNARPSRDETLTQIAANHLNPGPGCTNLRAALIAAYNAGVSDQMNAAADAARTGRTEARTTTLQRSHANATLEIKNSGFKRGDQVRKAKNGKVWTILFLYSKAGVATAALRKDVGRPEDYRTTRSEVALSKLTAA
jgi:hypothetical protein